MNMTMMMMKRVSSVLTLILILESPFFAMADRKLIEGTCKGTPFYNLCLSTLLSNPKSQNADTTGLALIVVAATRAKASQTVSKMKTISRPSQNLKGCLEAYNAVEVADIPEAVEALTKGDPKFAENGMADIALETDGCVGSLGGPKSQLGIMNKAVHDLSMVARAIIRMLL